MPFLRAYCKLILVKTIEYYNGSKFSAEVFLYELNQEVNKGVICNSQDKQYNLFSDIFKTILDHHALLKTERVRGNQTKFITKELRKSIINRSRYKNRYLKWPSQENFLAYKKAKTFATL